MVTDEAKTSVSRWLRNLDPAEPLSSWPAAFARVFDHVFGERHLSWRCFLRSCVASVASVAIITIIWAMLRREEAALFIEKKLAGGLGLGLAVIISTLAINTVPDYLSLLKTRYVIHWMEKRPSLGRVVGFLALDFVVTGVLASTVILLSGYLYR